MGKTFFCAMLLGSSAIAAPALANVEPTNPTPANDPGLWVTTDDYPPISLRTNEEGSSGFRVSIDAHGAVTGCEIVQTSNSAALDAATCAAVARRARFNPATDRNGSPVEGIYQSRVRWTIPRIAFPVPTAGPLVRKMVVEADGSITNCATISIAGGESRFEYEPCPDFYYEPFRDVAGHAKRKLVTLTGNVTIKDAPN